MTRACCHCGIEGEHRALQASRSQLRQEVQSLLPLLTLGTGEQNHVVGDHLRQAPTCGGLQSSMSPGHETIDSLLESGL